MPPAFSASRAGAMPEASGDTCPGTFGKEIYLFANSGLRFILKATSPSMNTYPLPLLILLIAAPVSGLIVVAWILLRPTSFGLPKRNRWIIISAFLSTIFASWIVSGIRQLHPAILVIPLGFIIFAVTTTLNKKKPQP